MLKTKKLHVPDVPTQPEFRFSRIRSSEPPPPPPPLRKGEIYTPDEISLRISEFFRDGFFDPASHSLANNGNSLHRGVRASSYFSLERREDGRYRDWKATRAWIYLPDAGDKNWQARIAKEFRSGGLQEACLLIPYNCGTALYMQFFKSFAQARWESDGRYSFWGPTLEQSGENRERPDQGQIIYYFGHRRREFRRVFKSIGFVTFVPTDEDE
jgi:hypothetical protein